MTEVTICSDFGAQEIKSVSVSTVSPSICHEVMGLDDDLSFLSVELFFSFFLFIFHLFVLVGS